MIDEHLVMVVGIVVMGAVATVALLVSPTVSEPSVYLTIAATAIGAIGGWIAPRPGDKK